jgi:glycosyltransferase involved in cell wall biosynthesis
VLQDGVSGWRLRVPAKSVLAYQNSAEECCMDEAGLVTIIMPNRDHARQLPRALDAILAQTWRQFELIVVDDASTDDSLDVITDFARQDARVRLLALNEHQGICRAVSAALATARGEFVYVASADDYVEAEFLNRCVAELVRNPSAGLTFSDPAEYYGSEQGSIPFPLYLSEQPSCFDPVTLVELLRRNYFHISANTVVYRISAFREAGGYLPDLHWFSDWFVTLVVALRHGACYLPEQLTCTTIRPDSYSARNLRDRNAQRALLNYTLELLELPGYADIAEHVRRAGLMPEYRFRTLLWLASNPIGRKYITLHLVLRTIGRSTWALFRPLTSVERRRLLRRQQSERTRAA